MRYKFLYAFTFFSLFIVLFNLSFGQSVEKLDAKYGFKNLKLGTLPNKSYLIKINDQDKNSNIKDYTYTGDNIRTLFTVPIKNIELSYYKNRLMTIYIQFNFGFSQSDYDIILYSLQKLFGDGYKCRINDPDISISSGREWNGKKVEMEIHRLYFNKIWSGYMIVVSKSLQLQKMNDEF